MGIGTRQTLFKFLAKQDLQLSRRLQILVALVLSEAKPKGNRESGIGNRETLFKFLAKQDLQFTRRA